MTWNGSRLLGSASVNAATDAFWSDVLTAGYHGYTDGYATVNGSVGVKWQGGAVTTTVKVTNLLNQTVQQHIFGDLLRRPWWARSSSSSDAVDEPDETLTVTLSAPSYATVAASAPALAAQGGTTFARTWRPRRVVSRV